MKGSFSSLLQFLMFDDTSIFLFLLICNEMVPRIPTILTIGGVVVERYFLRVYSLQ